MHTTAAATLMSVAALLLAKQHGLGLTHLFTETLLKPSADRSRLHNQDLHGSAIQRGQEPVQVLVPYGAKCGNAADDLWVPNGHAVAQGHCKSVIMLAKARLQLRDRMKLAQALRL